MAPPPSAKRVPSLQALLGLWRGDEESMGYAHKGLAQEICRLLRPGSELELFQQLYPGCELADVDVTLREMVALAYNHWSAQKGRK